MSSKKSLIDQFHNLKLQARDALLFLRLGDFYELFYEDAKIVSAKIGLLLTKRDYNGEEIPMCGFPASSVDVYVNKLVSLGYKVAICDQRQANNNSGLMEREIVRIVTAGTITDEAALNGELNNYLLSLYTLDEGQIGAGWTDITTGEISYCLIESLTKLNDFLYRLNPAEIICNSNMAVKSPMLSMVKSGSVCAFTMFDDESFLYDKAFKKLTSKFGIQRVGNMIEGLSLKRINPNRCICALGALFSYIDSLRADSNKYSDSFDSLENNFMLIDVNAFRTLEIFSNNNDNKKHGSLISILDKTNTAMGARTLRKWLTRPLINVQEICSRNDGVDKLIKSEKLSEIIEGLSLICDLERVGTRLMNRGLTPKDCLKISQSLQGIMTIKNNIVQIDSDILNHLDIDSCEQLNNLILGVINDFDDNNNKNQLNLDKNEHLCLLQNIESANILEIDKVSSFFESGSIKNGINKYLDQKRAEKLNCENYLDYILNTESEMIGIKLKIERSKVNGYYFEVAKSFVKQVPYRFKRIQTLTACERFKTEELIETEDKIIEIENDIFNLEATIFYNLLQIIKSYGEQILKSAKAIGVLDCLVSFSQIAIENNYVRPQMSDNDTLKIIDGRHPVVERSSLAAQSTLVIKNEKNSNNSKTTSENIKNFIPNDTFLDNSNNKIMLITGPNMSGKSVYMRQVALITIMAHIGCFVPAANAEICIVDQIFTRIGAGDDVTKGRSTFMVEMSEVANILNSASPRALLLIDEMGRGTSTYDGISLAWSVLESLSREYKAKVLFSTHYHELTKLEGVLSGINNYKMSIKEDQNSITFLRKLVKGFADRSFGIEVAGLAGINQKITDRAREVMLMLENRPLS